jgi:KaiC/GvpD/RAD55 family RecA-like ATPase
MARKALSRRPVVPRPATTAKPLYSKPRPARPDPAPEAAAAGLLQLKFGRHAHGYGIAAAVAFVANAILLYNMSSLTALTLREGYPDYILWLLPVTIGAIASWDAIQLKRDPYRGHFKSRHFVMSTLGMILFFAVSGFLVLMAFGILPVGYRVWVYPLTVVGVPATIISMAMTWQGLTARKGGSIALATILPIFVTLLVVGGQTTYASGSFSDQTRQLYLIVFLAGAVSTEIAGSLLHIIASSTSVYQREILKADNTKVGLLQQELQKKREALDYKERALRGREAHLEALQQELDDQSSELKTKFTDVAGREVAVEKGIKELRDLDRKVASAKAEIEARVEELKHRDADVASAKAETTKSAQVVAARGAALADREKETKRAMIELQSQLRASGDKAKILTELEERLRATEKALDGKHTALLKQEKDVQLRESALRLKTEQVQVTHSKVESERIKELKDWEAKILAKEKDLGKLEVELRSMESQLKERYENATRIERRFQEQRKIHEDREGEMVSQEQQISDKETGLRERAAELERQAAAVQEAQVQIDAKMKKYSELLKEAKMKEAVAGSSQEEVNQRISTLNAREKRLVEMQANLQAEIKRLNEQNRGLLEKAKEVEERENEISLREMELEQKARESRASVATPGMRDMDREAQLEAWEHRIRDREEEFKRRTYQKEKEIEMRESAVKAHLTTGVSEASEEAVAEEKKADKVKTGTPRLDDLLYGGIPFNSNVLFVGPAFVGKEVAILNFVAEGLKKRVPAILITTTKLPIDIARDMAPILPTFVEYEQLGLVRWIDCTSQTQGGKPVREKNVWRVNGPTDFDSIMNVVNQLDEEFKGKFPYFRLAFLTLSSSITQAEERDAMTFFQKLVNRLRQTKAVSAIALERGMHADQTLEAMEHMVDGAIHFKTDKQKTLMHVAGLGEVQTRDWVPYKFTNKAIMIGSFQLERIR